MLRYLYPLIILVLILLFCGGVPRPFSADSGAGSVLMVSSAVFLSTGWPLLIGHRLHEPAWRKLAEQLHLSYEPYGKKGDTDDIDLHNQELRFQDCHGLFMGAESDVNYLRRLIDVMCDLAEAIEHVAT